MEVEQPWLWDKLNTPLLGTSVPHSNNFVVFKWSTIIFGGRFPDPQTDLRDNMPKFKIIFLHQKKEKEAEEEVKKKEKTGKKEEEEKEEMVRRRNWKRRREAYFHLPCIFHLCMNPCGYPCGFSLFFFLMEHSIQLIFGKSS